MATTYLITNIVNGKMYVGFTVQSLRSRWAQHCCDAKGARTNGLLHKAIRKYGLDVFTIKALARGRKTDMLALEQSKIAELGTLVPDGYNLTSGGELIEFTPEIRSKMSKSAKKRAAGKKEKKRLAKILLEGNKKRWSKLGERETAAERMKKHYDPKAHAEKMREHWKDPEYRAKQSKSRKAVWAKNCERLSKTRARGERNTNAKLTADKVRAMRCLRAEGMLTYAEIARRFGVAKRTARCAVTGITWSHVD